MNCTKNRTPSHVLSNNGLCLHNMCRYVLLFLVMVVSSDQLQILRSYTLLLKPPILGSYIYRKFPGVPLVSSLWCFLHTTMVLMEPCTLAMWEEERSRCISITLAEHQCFQINMQARSFTSMHPLHLALTPHLLPPSPQTHTPPTPPFPSPTPLQLLLCSRTGGRHIV